MKKTASRIKTLKALFPYIRNYQKYLIASLLLSVMTVVATLAIPIYSGSVVDQLLGEGLVNFDIIVEKLIAIAILLILGAISQWLAGLCNNRLTYLSVRDIRNDAFTRLQSMPLSVIDKTSTGDIVSRIISDMDILSEGLLMGVSQLFTGVMTLIGALFFMFSVNAVIALVVVILTPLSLFVAGFIAKRTFTLFSTQSALRGKQTALVDEMIQNQKIVRAFGMEAPIQERYDDINDEYAVASRRAIFFSSLPNPATRMVNAMIYASVGVVGALISISTGAITVGQLSALLSYVNQYTKPFNEISSVFTEMQNAIACGERILSLMALPTETPEDDNATVLDDVDGTVSLEHVDFSYVPGKPFMEDLNLHVKKGQRIAIVGPTGCGKTTLIQLLMRFYDVTAGEIKVSDHGIVHVTRDSLRQSFGMVLQETWLKSGTVRENLIMGREDATDEEIIQAAKATHAHGFIQRLPDGYDTMLSADGGNLSQGQKQLLCITRVMICRPPMLILDEATSSIDTHTEQRVQRAFDNLMAGRTSFVVAHRLSTIQNADIILMMKDGNIVESGSHQQLLALGGAYAKLYMSQFSI